MHTCKAPHRVSPAAIAAFLSLFFLSSAGAAQEVEISRDDLKEALRDRITSLEETDAKREAKREGLNQKGPLMGDLFVLAATVTLENVKNALRFVEEELTDETDLKLARKEWKKELAKVSERIVKLEKNREKAKKLKKAGDVEAAEKAYSKDDKAELYKNRPRQSFYRELIRAYDTAAKQVAPQESGD